MSVAPVSGTFSAPSPIRGVPLHFSTDKEGKVIAYPSGKSAVARYITDDATATKGFIYKHSAMVTVCRLSPRGNMCLSGDENGNVVIWGLLPDTPVKYQKEALLAGPIRDAAWSDDQERIVVVADARGQSAIVFAVDGGNTLGQVTGHAKPIASCDFRPTRPFRIVTGGQDTQVNLHEGPPFKFAKGHTAGLTNTVTCVQFSPQGDIVAACSSAPNIQLLHGQTGEYLGEIKTEHKGTVMSIDFSADGKRVITASADRTVQCYARGDAETAWTKVWTATLGTKEVSQMQYGARFVRGGSRVLACSLDGTLTYLSPDTGAVVSQLRGHGRPILAVGELSTDKFFTAGTDGRVINWTIDNGNGAIRPGDALGEHKVETFNCFAGTPGGALAFGGGKAYSVEPTLKSAIAPVAGADANFPAITCTHLGKDLIVACSRQQLVVVTNNDKGETKASFDLKSLGFGDCTAVAASESGNVIAVAGGQTVVVLSFDGSSTISKKREFKGGDNSPHRSTIASLAFSPSGNLLASGDGSRMIAVFDLAKNASLYDDMIFHNGRVNCLAFFDEQTLYSGGGDSWVICWNLDAKDADRNKIAKDAHFGGVTALAKVGSYMVSTGFTGNVLTWKP